MAALRFIIPVTYFYHSRIKGLRDIIFHGYYEWLPNILILIFLTNQNILQAGQSFILAYVAFISIYEIGYLANDVYSVQYEKNPRQRTGKYVFKKPDVAVFVAIRILLFLAITFYLDFNTNPVWWITYFILIVNFILHNTIKDKQLKIFTFINLATIRFFAPVFIFIKPDDALNLGPGILLNYVFYRTLTYMDSKGLLNLPSRKEPSFKLNFYILIFSFSIFVGLLTQSYIPVIVNIYYMSFVLLNYTLYMFKAKFLS
jgi:hypothetical protein